MHQLTDTMWYLMYLRILNGDLINSNTTWHINPTGNFAIGGKSPINIYISCSGRICSIEKFIRNEIDLIPKGIIDLFNFTDYSEH